MGDLNCLDINKEIYWLYLNKKVVLLMLIIVNIVCNIFLWCEKKVIRIYIVSDFKFRSRFEKREIEK